MLITFSGRIFILPLFLLFLYYKLITIKKFNSMKKLNHFLNTASLPKIYLAGYLFTGSFMFILFYGFSAVEANINAYRSFLISALSAIPFGFLFSTMISVSRKSDEFWRNSDTVDKLIESAKTKSELENIFHNEFEKLKGLSLGHHHYAKIREIDAVIRTKYKYI